AGAQQGVPGPHPAGGGEAGQKADHPGRGDPAGTDGLSGPAGRRGLSAGVPLCRAGAAPIRRGPPPRHEADRKGGLRLGPHGDRHPGGG
ncbi:DUF2508 domain-containing protein, partial [Dysosmobacter welbionis]